ncbi:hypothetical protein M011DRAFT_468377 [Sporormia fimetaria CBS 119925]|uniref:PXA domain-containing protein n=1 Tax=Sporormia fimetaria CBS 119925 TaxID=1340428 RepID=A0A6A6V828_9PLEO|nr:hypothetical protein M011DRAFT_468377 [Sporormia fimetaria CBS 119925]
MVISDGLPGPRPMAGSDTGETGNPARSNVNGMQSEHPPNSRDDAFVDEDTEAFVRRTLCSQNTLLGAGEKGTGRSSPRPISDLLPPLTSSNAIDLQLYALVSIIIREFVQTWYTRITPDQVFVNEVIRIIAHCTRALEQRLREVDLEALLLDEIPDILSAHMAAFRLAKRETTRQQALISDPRVLYHSMHPHPALSPVPTEDQPSSIVEQRENESTWRQLLVQGTLAVILPTDDFENACLRSLVAEILAEMIIGNGVSGKACEGWLLCESISKVIDGIQPATTGTERKIQEAHRSVRHNAMLHQMSNSEPTQPEPARPATMVSLASVLGLFWSLIQYGILVLSALRGLLMALSGASPLATRCVTRASSLSAGGEDRERAFAEGREPVIKRPILSMKLWSCASQLVELDLRMPWLAGFASLLHWLALAGPGRVGDTDGILDRFLSHTVQTRILNPASVPALLRTIRLAIFPNNALGPARQPPSPEEVKRIKKQCAQQLGAFLPAKAAVLLFATEGTASQCEQIEGLLDCLDDAYINKHLVFQIVELVLLRLVPELGKSGVGELIGDRLG